MQLKKKKKEVLEKGFILALRKNAAIIINENL